MPTADPRPIRTAREALEAAADAVTEHFREYRPGSAEACALAAAEWAVRALLPRVADPEPAPDAAALVERIDEAIAICREPDAYAWPEMLLIDIRTHLLAAPVAKVGIADVARWAFWHGAKWWEWKRTGATMWQSDQADAWKEGAGRYDTDDRTAERTEADRRGMPYLHPLAPPEEKQP